MSFNLDSVEQLNIHEVVFYTTSTCGFMGYLHYGELVARGYVPLKDESCFTNGYLEREIDWIPGMKGIRIKDIPSFIRTTDPNDIMLNYNILQHENASRAMAILFNTYDELEEEVLEAIRAKYNRGLEDFQFKTTPDGLPPSNNDATQDIPALCISISKHCLAPFLELIKNLNESSDCPNVSCIVSNRVMSFSLDSVEQLNIPEVVFYTTSACGFIGYLHYGKLVARGYVPLKDESCFTNGYLEAEIDSTPGMKGIRLKDIPSFIRTTDLNDIMLNYNIVQHENASRAKAILFNTYDELEEEVLEVI
ncbi:unnamed protein product [Fraxinus pennsylvanica]|uniref:Uncharacterized protein n=1 Tax=Fraxinus pennsylvanica TaxID=56036 RepID=A0AAD1ZMQ7_9LAMI|nr:unnamed protein product [Fraxinus pennsylvanica]